jgi:UDP-N-acetylglucosamine 1-carboxyvinyltransferase
MFSLSKSVIIVQPRPKLYSIDNKAFFHIDMGRGQHMAIRFVVQGGQKLSGKIRVQGSKNASFAMLAACILVSGRSVIKNLPDISDVRNFLKILAELGAQVQYADHEATLDTSELKNKPLEPERMGQLRGSVLFAGALLGRFGRAELCFPGGDAIGQRPIDVHLDGFKRLGARVLEQNGLIKISTEKLTGSKITMAVTSVTGTENLILAAVRAEGETKIHLAATEPHVQDLCRFLIKMGARIEGVGTPSLKIIGVAALKPAEFVLDGDEIEAITFCAAAAAAKGEVEVSGINLSHLDAPLALFERMNVRFETFGGEGPRAGTIKILPPEGSYQATKIVTGVFPQLLTDHQPLFGVLATQAQGETSIHDWIYEGRQGYLKVLERMGARVEYDDVHRARIYGPVGLHGAEIKTPDIRAGASILIAALIARGQSIIYNAEIIDRGYERIDERLNKLGAKIQRIE